MTKKIAYRVRGLEMGPILVLEPEGNIIPTREIMIMGAQVAILTAIQMKIIGLVEQTVSTS